jgi:hypothetical protein
MRAGRNITDVARIKEERGSRAADKERPCLKPSVPREMIRNQIKKKKRKKKRKNKCW